MDDPRDRLFPGRARGVPADATRRASAARWCSSPRRTGLPPRPTPSAYCTAKAARSISRAAWRWKAQARHPRQRGQPRCGAARLEDLGGRMAGAARRVLQARDKDELEEHLSPALAAEALGAARGYRRGGLFLRLATCRRNRPATSSMSMPATRRRSRADTGTTSGDQDDRLVHQRGSGQADERRATRPRSTRITTALGAQLARRGIDIDAITRQGRGASASRSRPGASAPAAPALPAFPGRGEPRDIFDKLEDCAIIHAADPRDADGLAAYPLGQGRPGRRCWRKAARHWASASTR